MGGAIAVSANLDDITVTSGKDILSLYQFSTKTENIISIHNAGSIPIISAAQIPASLESMSPVWTMLVHSISSKWSSMMMPIITHLKAGLALV